MTPKVISSTKRQPKFLAIDTAQDETAIAVNETVVVWRSDRNQTNELLPKIDKLLSKLSMKPIQLDGVVVNLGPGSFTGLRVGVTVANGFGFGLGLPVAGVDLFAVTKKLYPDTDITVLPAGRGEIFIQKERSEPKLIKIVDLGREVKKTNIVSVVGVGLIPQIHEQLGKAGTIRLVNLTPQEKIAAMIGAAKMPKKFAQVLPLYIRGANITTSKKAKKV